MNTPLYHHLLVIIDWEISANELFLTEAEVEPALRALVADPESPLHLDKPLAQEILAMNFDDLRDELEERAITIYIHTIAAPVAPTPSS